MQRGVTIVLFGYDVVCDICVMTLIKVVSLLSCYFLQSQAELRLSEYHKLARKLKLIPMSAENACGHDFEIRPFECGPGSMVQHKTQIQVQPAILFTQPLNKGKLSYSILFSYSRKHKQEYLTLPIFRLFIYATIQHSESPNLHQGT